MGKFTFKTLEEKQAERLNNPRERVKAKLKEKPFNTMSRTEKDELLYDLLVIHGLIDTTGQAN